MNLMITDCLNYSREKSYVFQDADVGWLLDETLLLIERKPVVEKQFHIVRAFNGEQVKAHVDPNKIRQVFWNLCDNALRAMPSGGTLTAGVQQLTDSLRRLFPGNGIGPAPAPPPALFLPLRANFADGTRLWVGD